MVSNTPTQISAFKAVISLSMILAFRMLGLFMIYPVFSVATNNFQHATPSLVGIALGIYGLTQGLCQLPLSSLSDRYGRRPIILIGLIIFALGSMLAASTSSIYIVIIGRALQGCGAIGSTIMAFASDLTTNKQRTKAMAVLGVTIGMSFAIAIVLGPVLTSWFGLSGLFWLTAIFAAIGIFFLFLGTPKTSLPVNDNRITILSDVKDLLVSPKLISINFSIFTLHAILTASFIFLPELLITKLGLTSNQQWKLYLPTLLAASVSIFPLLQINDKKNNFKTFILASIVVITTAQFLWFLMDNAVSIVCALLLFFIGFTLLEAMLPSLVSKTVANNIKGTAMGIFSTWQFLGIFMGGMIGGIIQHHFGSYMVCLCCGMAGVLWLFSMLFGTELTQFKTELSPQ